LLQPPLYLRVTNAVTGRRENVLLSNVHYFYRQDTTPVSGLGMTDDDGEPTSFLDHPCTVLVTLVPSGSGVGVAELYVSETEQEVYAIMHKLMLSFMKMGVKNFGQLQKELDQEEWQKPDDEDEDSEQYDPYA
jgi:hypothetical protein